jgi:hypothetical protein
MNLDTKFHLILTTRYIIAAVLYVKKVKVGVPKKDVFIYLIKNWYIVIIAGGHLNLIHG